MIQKHQVSKYCGKNGADRLGCHRVATNLLFIKNAISVKHNKAMENKMRYIFSGAHRTYMKFSNVLRHSGRLKKNDRETITEVTFYDPNVTAK